MTMVFAFTLNANINSNDFDKLKKLEGKWMGMLERTDGTSDMLNLEYSITSNGSALLEESNTGGVEMLSIFNNHNDEVLIFKFKTDAKRSGLSRDKENFVDTWIISVSEDGQEMHYEYTVIGPNGSTLTATAKLKRTG